MVEIKRGIQIAKSVRPSLKSNSNYRIWKNVCDKRWVSLEDLRKKLEELIDDEVERMNKEQDFHEDSVRAFEKVLSLLEAKTK